MDHVSATRNGKVVNAKFCGLNVPTLLAPVTVNVWPAIANVTTVMLGSRASNVSEIGLFVPRKTHNQLTSLNQSLSQSAR